MQKIHDDELEITKQGGHANGRFAIVVLAILTALRMILRATLIVFVYLNAPSIGGVLYDHLGGPHLRAMTPWLL